MKTMATATIARAGGSGQVQQAPQHNRPLSNHRHNQPLMEVVVVMVEVEEAVEVVEANQHPLQEVQHPNKQQHPNQDQMAP